MSEINSQISIIIPAYNEEQGLPKTIEDLRTHVPGCEIIIINDGSTDRTAEIISEYKDVVLINHERNMGYGRALKTGMRHSTREFVIWFDADGQHPADKIIDLARPVVEKEKDVILASRTKESAFVIKRMPGKWVLKIFAQFAARQKIPDLNCGFRCFPKKTIMKYIHLLPDGFSASSTSTLIMIKRGYRLGWFPIISEARVGTSTVKIFRDGFRTLNLILRMILLFDAFLFFSSIALLQIIIAIFYSIGIMTVNQQGIPVLGAVLFICGFFTFLIGLVSSQISEMRLEKFEVD